TDRRRRTTRDGPVSPLTCRAAAIARQRRRASRRGRTNGGRAAHADRDRSERRAEPLTEDAEKRGILRVALRHHDEPPGLTCRDAWAALAARRVRIRTERLSERRSPAVETTDQDVILKSTVVTALPGDDEVPYRIARHRGVALGVIERSVHRELGS